jgi:hypothetical protein
LPLSPSLTPFILKTASQYTVPCLKGQ